MMKQLKKIGSLLLIGLLAACGKEEIAQPQNNSLAISTERYNSTVFTSASVWEDIAYGQSTTQGGQTINLMMDVFEPTGDSLKKRPLVILAHGGGFIGGNKDEMDELAKFLAKSGYVVAAINYRLLDTQRDQITLKRAVVDASQDMKAAVRFFKKDAATVNMFLIDTNAVFVGGYSAGAFTALQHAYVKRDIEILAIGGNDLLNYVNANGGIEGNSGNASYSSNVNAVINLAGALFKAEFVDIAEPALFSVHGTNDQVVPYMAGDADGSGVITEGSALIHQEANREGINNQLRAVANEGHDAFYQCNSCWNELRMFMSRQF